ncbi:signal peptide-containing protein [Theileria equi strain WA]|uniref:Signal peptide-containing protein n=1 Tax=Theileria equi strain WA TaxID=1537102 RepID=L0B322_THEEQ|nr:signal peptide-containing protein [Theileria equi strain WA]AFZ81504.1 signal peptide-containing protein [Theileria equi strain WA]|eukprot:XP_004831170.1 signal peptide-containing protein [Theileria equi strain WA]
MRHLLIISFLAFVAADVIEKEHLSFLFPGTSKKGPPFEKKLYDAFKLSDEVGMRTVILDLESPGPSADGYYHRAVNFTVQGTVSDIQRRVYKDVTLSLTPHGRYSGGCEHTVDLQIGSAIVVPGRRVLRYTSLGAVKTLKLSTEKKYQFTLKDVFNEDVFMDDFWVHLQIKSKCFKRLHVTLESPDNKLTKFPSEL